MIHSNIKRFTVDGILKDSARLFKMRDQLQSLMTHNIRYDGYVPLLDHGPIWSTSYDPKKEEYAYTISVYGIYVGKAKSWTIEGISSEGKLLPRIQKSK